jgi:hypothetical protein
MGQGPMALRRYFTSRRVTTLALWCAGSLVLIILAVVVLASWKIAGSTAPEVDRAIAQAELLIAALGLVVTVALVAITLWYARLTKQLADSAASTLEGEHHDRATAQASKVSVWAVGYEDSVYEAADRRRNVSVRIRNASDTPVFRCTVLVRPYWGEFPATSASDAGNAGYWAVLPPGDETSTLPCDPLPDLLTLPPVELVFTDANGRHWHRRCDGTLVELDDNPGGVC